MRIAVAVLFLLGALLPGSAHAKEGIERLRVCGLTECRSITDERTLTPLIAGLLGTEVQPAPRPSAFYSLVPEPTRGWPHYWPRYVYVPEAELVRQADGRGGAEWYPLIWTEGAYERATEGFEPFPEPVSWFDLNSAAPARDEETPFGSAVVAAVALAAAGGAGIGLLRRRKRPARD